MAFYQQQIRRSVSALPSSKFLGRNSGAMRITSQIPCSAIASTISRSFPKTRSLHEINKLCSTDASSSTSTKISKKERIPTKRQLRIAAIRSGIPMIGFEFMDNLVMIQAGEAIDLTLGVTFALSTLTAAGLGQVISDIAGVSCGGAVDAAVSKLNLPRHNLSQSQLSTKRCRIYRTVGGCVGVTIGCLMGMSCLLFMDTSKAERLKKAKDLQSIFRSVMEEGKKIVNAEGCTLWMWDKHNHELWSKAATTNMVTDLHVRDDKGVVGKCVQNDTIVNVHDTEHFDEYTRDVDSKTGCRTRSVIVVPVKCEKNGRVIGAIEMVNKKNANGTDGVFDLTDLKVLQMLSAHTSTFIRIVNGKEDC